MKKILFGILAIIIGFSLVTLPVYAADDDKNCVKTSILGDGNEVCDDGSGSSVMRVLTLVVDIMSIGVGILGVVGISIVGVQYLTAGGNEEQTRKAKRRMVEIIIGLAAYALIYALLKWLVPGFSY